MKRKFLFTLAIVCTIVISCAAQILITPPKSGTGGGGSGNFTGPGSSVANDLVCFADTTGILGSDCGILKTAVVLTSGSYADPAWITSLAFSKLASVAVTEAMLSFSDITTGNASTSQHGLVKKLDNNAAHFYNGQGNYVTPTLANNYITKTGTYSAACTDGVIEGLTNAFTITLPQVSTCTADAIIYIKNNQTANIVTAAAFAGDTIDAAGGTTVTTLGILNNAIGFVPNNGTSWRQLSSLGCAAGTLTSGGILYFPTNATCGSSAVQGLNLLVIGGGAGAAPFTASGIGTNGVDTFTTGKSPLNTPLIHIGARAQNGTAYLGLDYGTSNSPTPTIEGTNNVYASAKFTATGQYVQGIVPIAEPLNSTSVIVQLWYIQETTQTGAPVFTWSWGRAANNSTPDPTLTGCDSTATVAGTGGNMYYTSWTCTVTSLTSHDMLWWKFAYKTAPSGGASNMHVLSVDVMPVALKPIGGG